MSRVIVIRPEPGCGASVTAAREAGLEAVGFPLQEVVPVEWLPPDPDAFDAILAGSANVFRHGGTALQKFSHMLVHAVGQATAQAARAAGFTVERVGEGGLQRLLDSHAGDATRFLRLAGSDHIDLVAPRGVAITTCITYETVRLPMPQALAEMLKTPAVVLLHSAISAQHFAAECDRLGVHRGAIVLAALGPRIARAAGNGWRSVHNAKAPNDTALLAMVGDMCH